MSTTTTNRVRNAPRIVIGGVEQVQDIRHDCFPFPGPSFIA